MSGELTVTDEWHVVLRRLFFADVAGRGMRMKAREVSIARMALFDDIDFAADLGLTEKEIARALSAQEDKL